MITALYADGGVIGHNPSTDGGTWSWIQLDDKLPSPTMSSYGTGVITPEMAGLPAITNNLTEILALIYGLEALPADFSGVVYSDSMVSLGRLFQGWQWQHVPMWVHKRYQAARERLLFWPTIKYVLLDGHPTKAQLASGVGKRGHPCSIWNVRCDKMCAETGESFMLSLAGLPLIP